MTQPLLLPLPTRPALALEYAACFLAGREREDTCEKCQHEGPVESHGRGWWLCRECHVTAHGGGR